MKAKRVAVDFDGVIVKFGPLVDLERPPLPKVKDALSLLKTAGYEIVIFTSRLSPTWWIEDYLYFGAESPEAFGVAQTEYVKNFLDRWEIAYDYVTCEKIPAKAYFDDMAITVGED